MKRSRGMKGSQGKKDNQNQGRRKSIQHDEEKCNRLAKRKAKAAQEDLPVSIILSSYHILHGRKGNVTECPLALAIKDTFPSRDNVRVSPTGVQFTGTSRWSIGRSLTKLLCRYDATGEIHPLVLEARLKEQNLRLSQASYFDMLDRGMFYNPQIDGKLKAQAA